MLNKYLSVLVLLAGALGACAQNPSFELKRDLYSDYGGLVITQGDYNHDGKPDMVYAGGTSSAVDVTLRLGNGDGTFQSPIKIGTADSAQIYAIATADFNLDGNLDVAVMCIGGTFDVFYGDGQGGFPQMVATATTNSPRSLTVADFNRDGMPDIAIGDTQGNVEIFNNVGGQSFILKSTIPIQSNNDILVRAGDFDNDGIQNLAVLSNSAAYVLWNDGNENFHQQALGAFTSPAGISVGDLNQDGMDDILISYDCNPDPQNPGPKGPYSTCQGVEVYYGQGNQDLFLRPIILSNGYGAASDLLAVDVNGDGIGDIVAPETAVGSQTGMFIYLGHPDGSFDQAPSKFVATTDGMGPLAAADFNRDGMMDFAADLPGSAQTEIFLNATQRAACATSQISPTVTGCAPIDHTYLPGPNVHVQANTYDNHQVTALQLYVNNSLKYSQAVTSLDQNFAMNTGSNFLVIKAWDYTGLNFRTERNINVYNGTPGSVCSANLNQAAICVPSGTQASSPVHIVANGYTSVVPTAAQLYIDGVLVVNDQGCDMSNYCGGGTSFVDTSQTLAAGAHDLVFKLWDANGQVYTSEKSITVQ